ncbi:MAG: hypothetical protein JJU11_18455 [Candidatus Sumerlaeia bacterium]|nr:hypothetical protein [Candidatus Sumerlaeia bacterium]
MCRLNTSNDFLRGVVLTVLGAMILMCAHQEAGAWWFNPSNTIGFKPDETYSVERQLDGTYTLSLIVVRTPNTADVRAMYRVYEISGVDNALPGVDYATSGPNVIEGEVIWCEYRSPMPPGCVAGEEETTIEISLMGNCEPGERKLGVELYQINEEGKLIVNANSVLTNNKKAEITLLHPTTGGGTIGFSSASYSVLEGAGSVVLTIERENYSSGSAFVDFHTSNGTAEAYPSAEHHVDL